MWSVPITPISRPKNPAISPFSMSFAAITAIRVRPKSMTTTISTERRYRPSWDSQGSAAIVASVVISPPNTDAVKHSTSACCPCPFRVIGYPSSVVAAAPPEPGIFIRIAGMPPARWFAQYSAIMNAIATSTFTASVSGSSMIRVFCGLKPGRIPTTMPRRIAGQITHHRPNWVANWSRRNAPLTGGLEEGGQQPLDRPARQIRVEHGDEEDVRGARNGERHEEEGRASSPP